MAGQMDLRHAVRDEGGRLIGEGQHDTSRDSRGNVTSHLFPSFVVDVKREILTAVYNYGGAVTRAQIAKMTGRKKTPWLHEHIEDLVRDGYLRREQGIWKNGCLMYWYELNL